MNKPPRSSGETLHFFVPSASAAQPLNSEQPLPPTRPFATQSTEFAHGHASPDDIPTQTPKSQSKSSATMPPKKQWGKSPLRPLPRDPLDFFFALPSQRGVSRPSSGAMHAHAQHRRTHHSHPSRLGSNHAHNTTPMFTAGLTHCPCRGGRGGFLQLRLRVARRCCCWRPPQV